MRELSQYFKVTISSPEISKKQVSVDMTEYVRDGLKIIHEDTLLKECSFALDEAFLLMDVLAISMRVRVEGGDLNFSETLFSGYIKSLTPDFQENGEVILNVVAFSDEGGKLGVGIKDLVYPSENHPKPWARKGISYSNIIANLAKDVGIRVDSKNFRVSKDKLATFQKGAVAQRNMTDWAFIQYLATEIKATCWTEEKNGVSYIHLQDNKILVNQLSDYTFFFLARTRGSEFVPITVTSAKQIKLLQAKVTLDTSNTKGAYKQKTDPKTGETKIATEQENKETGDVERWVLDEAKVRALSSDRRQEFIGLFMSGKVSWEGGPGEVSAKTFFKKEVLSGSSREGDNANTVVKVAGGDLKADGINTQQAKDEAIGAKSYRTVVDTDKLKKLAPEDRTAIMGRIARGEMTEQDKSYYRVEDTTPKADKEEGTAEKSTPATAAATKQKKGHIETFSNKDKRDAGFSVVAKIYMNLNIVTRTSYIVEGLGKYSDSYYLYKITYIFGKQSPSMELVFVK